MVVLPGDGELLLSTDGGRTLLADAYFMPGEGPVGQRNRMALPRPVIRPAKSNWHSGNCQQRHHGWQLRLGTIASTVLEN